MFRSNMMSTLALGFLNIVYETCTSYFVSSKILLLEHAPVRSYFPLHDCTWWWCSCTFRSHYGKSEIKQEVCSYEAYDQLERWKNQERWQAEEEEETQAKGTITKYVHQRTSTDIISYVFPVQHTTWTTISRSCRYQLYQLFYPKQTGRYPINDELSLCEMHSLHNR